MFKILFYNFQFLFLVIYINYLYLFTFIGFRLILSIFIKLKSLLLKSPIHEPRTKQTEHPLRLSHITNMQHFTSVIHTASVLQKKAIIEMIIVTALLGFRLELGLHSS